MAVRANVAPEVLSKVTKALGITAVDQWYYVHLKAATKVIGASTLNKFGGSLVSFLKYAYPKHQFDEEKLASRSLLEKDQKFVGVLIHQLFPNTEIHTKARKPVGIVNPETGQYLEIDFWIPNLKLGIEYQDKHHYAHQWYANDTLEDYKKRDDIKRVVMSSLGHTLITIGYWWDKTIESLAATIRKARPDLLRDYERSSAEPVPSEPPLGFTVPSRDIPGVAGIMSPFVPVSNFDPTNWYGGEKHDGIRGVYNPTLNKMFSRTGNELSVLDSLLSDIPNSLVEGEVVAGRGNYSIISAVSSHTHHDKVNWPLFRYVVYDIPDAEMGDYTNRYSAIIRALATRPFIFPQLAFRVLLKNKSHLGALLDAIISDAGEGVIAQQDAQYECGRAKGLAKIKVRRDADAQVLHVNKLSCTCKIASGITTNINFSTTFKPLSTLKKGDIVSYYHDGYSKTGWPIRGEVYKVRYDITWKNLIGPSKLRHSAKRRLVKEALGSYSILSRNRERYKLGHWNKATNVRAFFDEFARKAGFDPLVPENWYSVRHDTVLRARGNVLRHYTLKQALMIAYPELKFEDESFLGHRNPSGHWQQSQNVRAFYDEFARSTGFDPLVPENWYSVTHKSVQQAGGSGLLTPNSGYLKKTLKLAYPELKFKDQKFRSYEELRNKRGHWSIPTNVRAYFDGFAQTAGFDPLIAENWHTVKQSSVQMANGSGLLGAFNYNMKKVLSFAYPELRYGEEHGQKP